MNLLLPFPPSINTYWRNTLIKTRKGPVLRTLLSKRGRQYRDDAIILIKKQVPVHDVIDYKVKMTIAFYPPTLRKYDVDNFSKAILDALTHANIWVDDELVYDLRTVKKEKHNGGAAVVSIERL